MPELVKGMTRERFLQNGETVGILKQLKDETSVDLTALEKKGLDRKTNHQNLMKTETKKTDEVAKAVEGEKKGRSAANTDEGHHLGETRMRRLNTAASRRGDAIEMSQCCGSQPRTWSTRLQSKKE